MLDLYLKLYYNYVRGGGVALIKKVPLKKILKIIKKSIDFFCIYVIIIMGVNNNNRTNVRIKKN